MAFPDAWAPAISHTRWSTNSVLLTRAQLLVRCVLVGMLRLSEVPPDLEHRTEETADAPQDVGISSFAVPEEGTDPLSGSLRDGSAASVHLTSHGPIVWKTDRSASCIDDHLLLDADQGRDRRPSSGYARRLR